MSPLPEQHPEMVAVNASVTVKVVNVTVKAMAKVVSVTVKAMVKVVSVTVKAIKVSVVAIVGVVTRSRSPKAISKSVRVS